MKKILTLIAFFLFAPINLLICLSILSHVPKSQLPPTPVHASSQLYASLPQENGQILGAFQNADSRTLIIQKYLLKYKSPMAPFAGFIVQTSDKYGLDWRLLVAIAQQESNLGKRIPPDSHNAWGYGIHSRGTLKFASWEEGIETVAKGLKEKYLDKGYRTTEEIMSKYTPLSNGSWAHGVNQFLAQLETGQVE